MNLIRLYDFSSVFDFLRWRKITLLFSTVLVLLSLGLFATVGLNLGVDFQGGVLVEVRMQEGEEIGALRSELNGLGIGEVGLQTFGQESDYLITLQRPVVENEEAEQASQKAALEAIRGSLGERVEEYRRVETVGPTISGELKTKAFWATIYALIGIAIYIAFRFEWRYAIAALIALIHDVITTLGLFVVTQFQFDLATVAAILTIAGYSINDTVVVFDRTREELRRYKKKSTLEILNIALNRTLSRTLMTSVTTLLALFALAIFGGPVIRGFSIALIWGVVIGTYSSLFLATPLLYMFGLKRTAFDRVEKPEDDGAAAFVQNFEANKKSSD